MNLRGIITKNDVLVNMLATDKRSAIHELIEFIRERHGYSDDTARKMESAILRRENRGSTGIGKGVATPHAKNCLFVDNVVAALGVSPHGIEFGAIDDEPVTLVFLLISPRTEEEVHLKLMRKVAYLARDDKTIQFLKTTTTFDSLEEILEEVDERF